jgi:D-glycero-D-manno-heptose 1,7-bisphosphate phosphatase
LDRDGVLNRAIVRNGKPYPPPTLNELEVLPGVPEGLQTLKQAGFLLIVVTNQPDVARGSQRREVVEAINTHLLAMLPLDEIRVCYHDDRDTCQCRKPQPGLLLEAAVQYDLDLSASFIVGDRWKDIEAGHRAGCITILIDCGYAEREADPPPNQRVSSLAQAAMWILSQTNPAAEEIKK